MMGVHECLLLSVTMQNLLSTGIRHLWNQTTLSYNAPPKPRFPFFLLVALSFSVLKGCRLKFAAESKMGLFKTVVFLEERRRIIT